MTIATVKRLGAVIGRYGIVCVLFGLAAAWLLWPAYSGIAADGESRPFEKGAAVRKLKATVDPLTAAKLAAKPGVTVITSAENLAKSFGEAVAKQLVGNVDFAKENLVYVSWLSTGPPFGTLQYAVKEEKGRKTVAFHVEEPKVAVRGQAARLGSDFFAVPKDMAASFRQ